MTAVLQKQETNKKVKPQLRVVEPTSRLLVSATIDGVKGKICLSLKKENEPPERILAKFLYEMCST